MGSYNLSCFISRQTIQEGDEVYIIPIVPVEDYKDKKLIKATMINKEMQVLKTSAKYPYNSCCYSDSFYEPFSIGFAIRATYNDYGSFKICDDKNNISMIREFLRQFKDVVWEVEDNPVINYGELLFNLEVSFTDEDIINALTKIIGEVNNNNVFVNTFTKKASPLMFSVCSSKIVNYSKKEYSMNKEILSDKITQQLDKTILYFQEKYPKYWKNDVVFNIEMMIRNKLRTNGCSNIFIPDLLTYITDYIENNNIKEFFDKIFDYIPLYYIGVLLDDINVSFSPILTSGQDYDNIVGNLFLKMVLEINKEINQEIEEECDECD